MLQQKSIKQISVTDICKKAGLNISTFYANHLDVYDLADKIREKMDSDFYNSFHGKPDNNGTKFFRHIYDNRSLYKVYSKLSCGETYLYIMLDFTDSDIKFDGDHKDCCIEFFRSGITAVIKKWLEGDCKESPEEMAEIIYSGYRQIK